MRNWLTKNKIFFETIAVTLLGVMAVVLSLRANQTAELQNNLINTQLRVMKIVEKPLIRISTKVSEECNLDDESDNIGNNKGYWVELWNDGGPIDEPNFFHTAFIEVVITKGSETRTILLRVQQSAIVFGRDSKELVRKYCLHSVESSEKELHDLFNDDFGPENISLQAWNFFRLEYQDLFDGNHIKYYTSSYPDVVRLPLELGKALHAWSKNNECLIQRDFHATGLSNPGDNGAKTGGYFEKCVWKGPNLESAYGPVRY